MGERSARQVQAMSTGRRIRKMGALVLAYYDGKLGRRRASQKFLSRATRALKRYYRDATERVLRTAVKGIRPHASFFKWTSRQKETEELGVVESVGGALAFRAVCPGQPDPPDAVGEREDGSLVAIEVTELVDEQVAGHNVKAVRHGRSHETVHRVWDEPGLVAAVEERLKAKDGVTLNGGPFAEYVVALHTDEMMLTHADAEAWLGGHTFTGMRQVTEAYLSSRTTGKAAPTSD
jgi:hypothetical protein